MRVRESASPRLSVTTAAVQIISVEAAAVRVPLDRVTSFATRTVRARDYGLVRVRTSDGAQGIGFCYAGSVGGGLVAQAVRELFAPLLIGEDPYRVEGLWVGCLSPSEEEERIAAAREAIGPGVLLILDANNAWSDLPTALRYMARYEPDDPCWIEEPFGPDDIDNHAKLAQRTPVVVATGEIEAARWRPRRAMASPCVRTGSTTCMCI